MESSPDNDGAGQYCQMARVGDYKQGRSVMRGTLLPMMMLLGSIVCTSSACSMSPERARRELTEIGVEFTPQKFVESATNGDLAAIELFLVAGIDVDVEVTIVSGIFSRSMTTALTAAAREGHAEVVEALLGGGAYVDAVAADGSTALMLAADGGHRTVVHSLLESGASINRLDDGSSTALALAAERGHGDIVDALMEAGASALGVAEPSALERSVRNGRIRIAEALLDHGADPNWASEVAVRSGRSDLVALLVDRGADPDDLLCRAVWSNSSLAVVHDLLEYGADPNLDMHNQGLFSRVDAPIADRLRAAGNQSRRNRNGEVYRPVVPDDTVRSIIEEVLPAGSSIDAGTVLEALRGAESRDVRCAGFPRNSIAEIYAGDEINTASLRGYIARVARR